MVKAGAAKALAVREAQRARVRAVNEERSSQAPSVARLVPRPFNASSKTHKPPVSGAKFILSAADAQQFPPPGRQAESEIAFLGRSNVGKSSLLNRLVQQPGLAFTSARPGCTQLINFFEIDESVRFVDLPGYGYARVSLEERASWKKLIESYLLHRETLALSLLLIDARRGWMDMDLELKAWLEFHNRRHLVVATKIDKLKSNNQLKAALDVIRKDMPDGDIVPFSAVDGRGVREIWQTISKIKNKQ